MKIKFNTKNSPFEISNQLLEILAKEIDKVENLPEQLEDITYSFRDENYDSESGGYHPVEIRLVKTDGLWCFDYITDFSFVGSGQDAELTKEIDFDFTNGIGFHLYTGEHQLKILGELYGLWEVNFISYFEMGVFKVKISTN